MGVYVCGFQLETLRGKLAEFSAVRFIEALDFQANPVG